VFPTRYELNSYIVFRKRLVSKKLNNVKKLPHCVLDTMLSFSTHASGAVQKLMGFEGKILRKICGRTKLIDGT
jgi:hypothetical protein